MTVRQAELSTGPAMRVLKIIDRFDSSDGAIDELHRFLEESPENERLFIETTEGMHATSVTLASEYSVEEQPGTLGAAAGRPEVVAANDSWFTRHVRPLALVAAVVVAVAFPVWYFSQAGQHRAQEQSESIKLPDGSPVLLYAQSEVHEKYSREERRVDLDRGGGAFEVAHNDARPFKVYVDDLVITAKGTQFNVIRRADRADVGLLEGTLDIFRNRILLLHMEAGDTARIRKDGTLEVQPREVIPVGGMTYAQAAEAFNKKNDVFPIEVRGAARDIQIQPGSFADLSAPGAWLKVIERDPAIRVAPGSGAMTIEAAPSN